jgi:ParB family chromosome partitioning protein
MGSNKKDRAGGVAKSPVIDRPGVKMPDLVVGTIVKIPLVLIRPNPDQPRKVFLPEDIAMFAESLKSRRDVEQPIEVLVRENGAYVLIKDGERRWRASKEAKLYSVSCLIRPPMTDKELYLSSAKANFGRKEMTVVEQAYVAKRLTEEYGWTQQQVATEMSVSIGTVQNMLKIFRLHEDIQSLLIYDKIDKVLAYSLVTYPKESQLRLLGILREEVTKKQGPLGLTEAVKILRRETEKANINPAPSKKRKKLKSHAQLVILSVLRYSERLRTELEDLTKIDNDVLQKQGGGYTLPLAGELRATHEVLTKALEKVMQLA